MKVLIAIDHKPSSQAIVDALVKMHWIEGTELFVMTVRDEDRDVTEIEEVAVELHNALTQCQVSFFAPTGDPKTAILGMAAQVQADLIIVGSNCKNTLERVLIGSVCQSVLNGANIPVIVAKTPCCLAREASPGFRNILIPVDNSIFSDVAVSWLANFGWASECRFIVAAAVEEDTDMKAVRDSLKKRASTLSKLLNTQNVVVEAVVGEPKQVILDLAKKYYADLITIGSHGRTGLRKLILGNVAQSVSHEAPCAVAIVRGIAPDDENWQDTGAFDKVEPIPVATFAGAAPRRESRDLAINIMPGGM
jgi:nucleotide-binding universal stress UspA family protein